MSSTSPTVDLNCDLGEGFGRYSLGCDEEVIPLVSSVNVACGMHAGDPLTMAATVRRAADAGVAVGRTPATPTCRGSAAATWPSRPTRFTPSCSTSSAPSLRLPMRAGPGSTT